MSKRQRPALRDSHWANLRQSDTKIMAYKPLNKQETMSLYTDMNEWLKK